MFTINWASLDLKQLSEFAAHYVFWSSVIVNALACCELICHTVQEWAIDNYPGSGMIPWMKEIEKTIGSITDLIDRLGAINFKNVIRPRRQRASDLVPDPIVVKP